MVSAHPSKRPVFVPDVPTFSCVPILRQKTTCLHNRQGQHTLLNSNILQAIKTTCFVVLFVNFVLLKRTKNNNSNGCVVVAVNSFQNIQDGTTYPYQCTPTPSPAYVPPPMHPYPMPPYPFLAIDQSAYPRVWIFPPYIPPTPLWMRKRPAKKKFYIKIWTLPTGRPVIGSVLMNDPDTLTAKKITLFPWNTLLKNTTFSLKRGIKGHAKIL